MRDSLSINIFVGFFVPGIFQVSLISSSHLTCHRLKARKSSSFYPRKLTDIGFGREWRRQLLPLPSRMVAAFLVKNPGDGRNGKGAVVSATTIVPLDIL